MRWLVTLCMVTGAAAAVAAEPDAWTLQSATSAPCEQTRERLNRGLAAEETGAFRLAGILFERGVCVTADPSRSAAFYMRAAERADRAAMRRIALLFALGHGVPQDYGIAGAWLGKLPPTADYKVSNEDYQTGYAYVLTRYVGDGIALPMRDFELSATFSFVPADPLESLQVALVRRPDRAPPAPGSLADLRNALAAAMQAAVARLPKPDAARLAGGKRFTVPLEATTTGTYQPFGTELP